jgi:hypothetical protein
MSDQPKAEPEMLDLGAFLNELNNETDRGAALVAVCLCVQTAASSGSNLLSRRRRKA